MKSAKQKVKVKPVVNRAVRVDREEFLRKLEEVRPGLSTNDVVEQSSCFVFTKGQIVTFNEEIACKTLSGLDESVTGAVQHRKLVDMLRKLPDAMIDVAFDKKELVIKGKNKETAFAIEHDVKIPINVVQVPDKWRKISEDFTDAIGIVQECATKDQTAFTLTCVHIHPKWMEAFDNSQMARYNLKTGVEKPFLVKRDSIKFLPSYECTHIAETDNWLHFKTSTGTIISLVRYVAEAAEYQNLTNIMQKTGDVVIFPTTLSKAAERANIHSADNTEKNLVTIELKAGKLRIQAKGDQGRYVQKMGIKYGGRATQFQISPSLLIEILKRETDCQITKDLKLKVQGDKWVYLACLEKV